MPIRFYILDEQRRPLQVDGPEHKRWSRGRDLRVGRDIVGRYEVVTTFVSMTTESTATVTPHLFLTRIRHVDDRCGFGAESVSYATWEEAEVGHRKAMDLIRTGPADRSLALDRFSREVFERAEGDHLLALCQDLASVVSRRFEGPAHLWATTGYAIVEELKRLGHELWSYDEGHDFQMWSGDHREPGGVLRFSVYLHQPNAVEIIWRADSGTASARVGEGSGHDE